jgi:hypothetical protein
MQVFLLILIFLALIGGLEAAAVLTGMTVAFILTAGLGWLALAATIILPFRSLLGGDAVLLVLLASGAVSVMGTLWLFDWVLGAPARRQRRAADDAREQKQRDLDAIAAAGIALTERLRAERQAAERQATD